MIITAVDNFSKPIKKLSAGLAKAGSMAAGLGKTLGKVAIGITATVGALSLVVGRYVEMLDKIGKTSEKLGIDPTFLQKLRFAAEQTGVEVRALDMGLQRFIRRTAEAARGTGEAKGALNDLGIQLVDNEGKMRDVQDVLFDVADAIAATKDSAEQVRLAFKFFDSEGVALVATLKQGSEGLKAFFREAENLGILISSETVKRAEEFADSINRVKKQFTAIGASIVGAFLPALNLLSNKLTSFLSTNRDVENTFDSLGKKIAMQFVAYITVAIMAIGRFANSIEEALVRANNQFIDFQVTVLEVMSSSMFFGDQSKKITELLEKKTKATGAAGKALNKFALDFLKVSTELINSKIELTEFQKELAKLSGIEKVLFAFANGFSTVIDNANKGFEDITKLGEEVATKLETGLTDAFLNIADGLEGLKDLFDDILKMIARELIRVNVAVPIAGAIGDLFKADGGPVRAGRSYIVGERGPELFTPGASGHIHPNGSFGGGSVVVNQSINLTTGVVPTVRAEVQKLMPQIAEVTKGAVAEAAMRGGSYRRALQGG